MGEAFEWKKDGDYLVCKWGLYEADALQVWEDIGCGSGISFDGVRIYSSSGGCHPENAEKIMVEHHAAFDPFDQYVPWCMFDPDEWLFGWEHELNHGNGGWWELVGPCASWSWLSREEKLFKHDRIVKASKSESVNIMREYCASKRDEAMAGLGDSNRYAGRLRVCTNPMAIRMVSREAYWDVKRYTLDANGGLVEWVADNRLTRRPAPSVPRLAPTWLPSMSCARNGND
jgi:hypothetical protein